MASGRINAPRDNAITRGIEGVGVWEGTRLTYAFATEADTWRVGPETGVYADYRPLGEAHRFAVEQALAAIERVTMLRFERTDRFDAADLKLVGASNLADFGMAGFAQYPWTNPKASEPGGYESFLALDTTSWAVEFDPRAEDGPYLCHLVLHELGHALGLAHPHDTGNGTTAWTEEAAVATDDPLDNERFTMMSYEMGGIDARSAWRTGHAVTPSAIDIAALQHMYGANPGTHAGDTTYWLADPPAGPPDADGEDGSVTIGGAFYCIWDTGGVDTIRYAGTSPALINLNDATLVRDHPDNVALVALLEQTDIRTRVAIDLERELMDPRINAGGFFSRTWYGRHAGAVPGGYAIAEGVVIENAIGGSGDDVLIGNEYGNELSGGSGADLLIGQAGADLLRGGLGADELWGGPGADRFEGTPAELNGERIRDFSVEDEILVLGVRFDRRQLVVDPATGLLRIDTDGNRASDTSIELSGGLGGGRISVEPAETGAPATLVRYTLEPNLPPIAGDDRVRTAPASPVLIDVLANDVDPDGFLDPSSVRIVMPPARGSASVESDGRITYVPDPDTAGEVRLRYTVADLDGAFANEAEVVVIVAPNAVEGGPGNDRISGGPGADRIRGRAGNDRLDGAGGPDVVVGGAGNDRLAGGTGDDILVGGLGRDAIDGGPGLDIAVFLGRSGDFTFASRGAKRTVSGLASAEGRDTLVGIERIQFTDGWLDTSTGTFRPGYASAALETLLAEERSWLEG